MRVPYDYIGPGGVIHESALDLIESTVVSFRQYDNGEESLMHRDRFGQKRHTITADTGKAIRGAVGRFIEAARKDDLDVMEVMTYPEECRGD